MRSSAAGAPARGSPRSARAMRQRKQGGERERQERGFMRPIFEHSTLASLPPGGAIDQGAVIGPEPGESRQVMGTGEHVDAVDLVERQPVERAPKPAPADEGRAPRAESLRGQRDPPRGGQRDCAGGRYL